MTDKKKKNEDKLFTPGNIILGVIIIVLIGSLFFDFFGKNQNTDGGCPQVIPSLIISNFVYTKNSIPINPSRLIVEDDDPNAKYEISALLRNLGKEDIAIENIALTEVHMGALELTQLDEPVIVEAGSMKTMNIQLPSGTTHKIDIYTANPCEGNNVWHDQVGHGLEEEYEEVTNEIVTEESTANMTIETETPETENVEEPVVE
ncbi:MAG: hypothetical protein ABIC91_00430 [Nanoarchaeota archaeon]|nr:hypothetical protein [Nanoarchaeota archaeon]